MVDQSNDSLKSNQEETSVRLPESNTDIRLDSWKEIAAYLNRDVRTAQRWERHEGLPIHRHLHKERSTVWAYRHEIDTWATSRRTELMPGRTMTSDVTGQAKSSKGRKMLAVLPFMNLTGIPDHENLTDGLTEEIISQLCRLPDNQLGVIARTSVMRYKSTSKSIREIAHELGVDYVLEGSVRNSGKTLRMTAQLIRARDESHVWSESYQQDLQDALKLQCDIAQGVADEIHLRLTPGEQASLPQVRQVDPHVYESYVKGMHFLREFTPDAFRTGLKYLAEAVGRDPNDPLPWAGLALGYSMVSHSDLPTGNTREAYGKAKEAALQALKLDDSLGEAHLALAESRLYFEWDWPGAERSFRRALALKPDLAEAHRHFGQYNFLLNRKEEAAYHLKRAAVLEPLTPLYATELAWFFLLQGDLEPAMEEIRKALELNPQFPLAIFLLGNIFAEDGHLEEAVAQHRKAVEIDPIWNWALAHTLIISNQKQEARKILASLEREFDPLDAWHAWSLAIIHTGLGNTNEAFRHLFAACELRHGWMPWLLHNPYLASLRDDSRFQELVHLMKLPD